MPITVVAAEEDDSEHESLTIQHSIYTLSAECLGYGPRNWAPDPVYVGRFGLALDVTERDNHKPRIETTKQALRRPPFGGGLPPPRGA